MQKFPLSFALTSLVLLSQGWADSPLESPGGVNLPVRPQLERAYNFFVSADALYWQAVEENLIYSYTGNAFLQTPEKRDIHSPHFDWNWGYRLSAGCNIPRDGWDLALQWTHMRSTAQGEQLPFPPDPFAYQVWLDPFFTTFSVPSSHWHATLDQVDLQCGRAFQAGQFLALRPHFGMRSTWLPQELRIGKKGIAASSSPFAVLLFKNDFWGYGFTAGLDSDWELGKGFGIYALSDIAILFGFFEVSQKNNTSLSPQELNWDWKKSFRVSRPVLDLAMGLKWAHLFCQNRFGITFKIGYEYHLYFDQNQFSYAAVKSTTPSTAAFATESGNLIYQGASGSLQFDF